MADTFGLVQLPALDTDVPVGDPVLAKLGAYIRAVVNVDLAAAWAKLRPRIGNDGLGARSNPIRTVVTHDPEELDLNDNVLPALFIYRQEEPITQEAEDWLMSNVTFRCLWVYPNDEPEKQSPRNPFANAIGKSVTNALDLNRNSAWVDVGDTDPTAVSFPAIANSIMLSRATSTSPATYSGAQLNGSIGAAVMSPRREPTITTTPATGAYKTNVPLVLQCVNWFGLTVSKTIQPTLTNGGETLGAGEDVKSIVSITDPGQNLATGTFQCGTSAVMGRGSELQEACALERIYVKSWKPAKVEVQVLDGDGKVTDKLSYLAVEILLNAREKRELDLTNYAKPQTRLDYATARADGSIIDNATIPDNSHP